ncbi:MAG: MarR family transcriptional regulator [Deltaproteobacteria bacterium]|nr:MarR family transcriptional regulator [Deltaproteobacteria bacterium]MBW2142460.1 MarR family transcriptional regulator [Deltaproteobacteria bacterium]
MVRKPRAGSTQSRTLDAIRANGQMTVKELQEALLLPGAKGYARISKAAQDLMKAGYVERIAPATYRYLGEPRDLDYLQTQKRMVRIIRIRTKRREPFTARKLAELSDCSADWAKRYIKRLLTSGHLEKVSYELLGPSRVKAPTYLAMDEKLNEEWPTMRRQKKTSKLDHAAKKIREMAYQAAANCQADRESLIATAVCLRGMISLIQETLEAKKNGAP